MYRLILALCIGACCFTTAHAQSPIYDNLTVTGTLTVNGQVITNPAISHTYTASGAVALSDKLAKIACAADCTMTLAASTTPGQTLLLNNYGSTTAIVSASLQGAPATLTMPGNSGASVSLWWDAADATWLIQ